jgi:hypothetical protein
MAESSNGHDERTRGRALATEPIDLDALMPGAMRRRVRIEGIEYPVRQIIHFSEQEEADLRALEGRVLEAEAAAAAARAQPAEMTDPYPAMRRANFDLAFWLVRALVPELPEVVRRRVTLTQAWVIAGVGRLATTENPPLADTGTGTAAPAESSKPVSADSTAVIPAPSPV